VDVVAALVSVSHTICLPILLVFQALGLSMSTQLRGKVPENRVNDRLTSCLIVVISLSSNSGKSDNWSLYNAYPWSGHSRRYGLYVSLRIDGPGTKLSAECSCLRSRPVDLDFVKLPCLLFLMHLILYPSTGLAGFLHKKTSSQGRALWFNTRMIDRHITNFKRLHVKAIGISISF